MKMLRYFRRILRRQNAAYELLLYMRYELMSKLDELKAEIAEFKDAALAEVDKLQAAVKDLKDKVGSGITDADVQAVIDQVEAAKKALADDVAADAAPAPEPVEEPAPVEEAPEVPAEPEAPAEG
jgi:hypothetical protein